MLNVVTVTFNDLHGLKLTIDSLNAQTDKNFNLIVVDGASTDGTVEYLNNLSPSYNFRFVSERDRGIYDAMNKGILLSNGTHIWFLNGGDTCFEKDTIKIINSKIIDSKVNHHFFAVKMISNGWTKYKKASISPRELVMSMPVCHQGMVCLKSALEINKFDTNFSIAADHHFLINSLIDGDKYQIHEEAIALFNLDGVSSKRIFKALRQQFESSLELEKLGISKNYIKMQYGIRLFRATLAQSARKLGLYSVIQRLRFSKS